MKKKKLVSGVLAFAVTLGTFAGLGAPVMAKESIKTTVENTKTAPAYNMGKVTISKSSPAAKSAAKTSAKTSAQIGESAKISVNKTYLVKTRPGKRNKYTFKAPKTGFIFVSSGFSDVGLHGNFSLYIGKKAVSRSSWMSELSNFPMFRGIFFGVKKGVKYTLVVDKGNSLLTKHDGNNYYTLKVKMASISEKSGRKQSKSGTIKKNKTIKGVIEAGKYKPDYYKFKVTKGKKIVIYFSGATSDSKDSIIAKVTHRSGRFKYTRTVYINRVFGKKLTLKGSRHLIRGTYYIKLYKEHSKSNGFYNIKWK